MKIAKSRQERLTHAEQKVNKLIALSEEKTEPLSIAINRKKRKPCYNSNYSVQN